MGGIKTNILDLRKCARQFRQAMIAEDQRKREMINEFKNEFIRQKFPPYRALQMAQDKYNSIHKRKL